MCKPAKPTMHNRRTFFSQATRAYKHLVSIEQIQLPGFNKYLHLLVPQMIFSFNFQATSTCYKQPCSQLSGEGVAGGRGLAYPLPLLND